ncbi:hypothetical protein SAMN03159355_05501 [Pseudomonas sp. NFPP10]|nr:hypothetical protein SAMN03159465_01481 [Pseudomonas sp. NFPP12]SEM61056.1 hypothetical protein SAMN03159355_05501 [Pseudomonas sp. NFPP10]SFI21974.1 hypothetical protein SAMN03159416_01431 [Pseudomonas sp. NFPP08]SFN51178.1 hypothetical protein SAMN03159476_05548 [Pseudomonas sp. NFPP05]SFY03151.1 hypothetical protein SAMN03159479_05503 [Pseudomonas sp. NFPP09]
MQVLDIPQRSFHVLQVLGEDRGTDAQRGRSLGGKGLQQVHGVNDERAVSCIFTLGVRERLNRLNGKMWVINQLAGEFVHRLHLTPSPRTTQTLSSINFIAPADISSPAMSPRPTHCNTANLFFKFCGKLSRSSTLTPPFLRYTRGKVTIDVTPPTNNNLAQGPPCLSGARFMTAEQCLRRSRNSSTWVYPQYRQTPIQTKIPDRATAPRRTENSYTVLTRFISASHRSALLPFLPPDHLQCQQHKNQPLQLLVHKPELRHPG